MDAYVTNKQAEFYRDCHQAAQKKLRIRPTFTHTLFHNTWGKITPSYPKNLLSITQNLIQNLETIEECENTNKTQLPNSSAISHQLDNVLIEPRPPPTTPHSKTNAQSEIMHNAPLSLYTTLWSVDDLLGTDRPTTS